MSRVIAETQGGNLTGTSLTTDVLEDLGAAA